jgi:HJR/Mrr/RecB family endonuclease
MGFVTHVSGRTVAVVTIVLYPGAGLGLPLALNWSVIQLVEANILGALFAGIISLGWLSAQVEAGKRRHLMEWTTDLRLLSAEEFEWLAGETFRREGWRVRETGRQDAPDGNIDLELTREGQRKIVQCKRWESWLVKVDEIRRFAGTLFAEGLPGTAGIFVTLSDFTEQARAEAQKTGITLFNGRDMYSKVEKARRPEPCPTCQRPMLFDRSPRGWWLRCVAPGCSGKRDLGSEPGRAIELLTQSPPLRRWRRGLEFEAPHGPEPHGAPWPPKS